MSHNLFMTALMLQPYEKKAVVKSAIVGLKSLFLMAFNGDVVQEVSAG
jgi:hypothetical protein